MFGHRDDQPAHEDNDSSTAANEEVITAGADHDNGDSADGGTASAEPESIVTPDPDPIDDSAGDGPAPEGTGGGFDPVSAPVVGEDASAEHDEKPWQHPGEPLEGGPEPISDVISPAGGFPKAPS